MSPEIRSAEFRDGLDIRIDDELYLKKRTL